MLSSEKKIPKSLKECYATDNVSSNLWGWSEWLEVWGGRVLVILIIIGIISTIAQAVQVAQIDENLVFLTVITSIATWVLYAFIEYCAYHVLSLLIASLATIVQNTRITANVAIYNVAKEEGILKEGVILKDEPKKSTPSASKQNTGYSLSKLANERKNSNSFWICKECGTKNDESNLHCKDCGKYK